jgi:steroid 5-alpha reductase family enzyme
VGFELRSRCEQDFVSLTKHDNTSGIKTNGTMAGTITDSAVRVSDTSQHVVYAAGAVKNALTSGSNIRALLALSAVGILTIAPITLVHHSYCVSVGYGAAVASMSLSMILSFGITIPRIAPELLLFASFVYGIRLATFLLARYLCVKNMRDRGKMAEKLTSIQTLSLVIILSGLFACMVSPVLFLLRDDASLKTLQCSGVVLAYAGLALEAITDQHKFNTKRRHNIAYGEKRFVGPTGGAYSLCRHPNFLGEIMFWTGLLLGGMSSFGKSMTPWICGTLGWLSIVQIMFGSEKRIEEKQLNNYGGQNDFEKWRERVKSSLIPFFF